MAEHERIWLEPERAPYRCWCQDNQWGEEGVKYVLASTLESLQRENEELRNLSERLRKEAQTHAMEARSANATINEIYQIISGGKGEPGNWNGAEPVRQYVEVAEDQVKRLHELLRFAHDTLWEINPSNYDHDDVCKLNDASVEVILTIAPELGETHGKSKEWWEERQALASTGGEHHGN